MKKLKKLLSDQRKDIRHRRHMINLHIAVLGWLVELSGFFLVILGSFILGHGNVTITLTLQTFTMFMMFNILPCVYLINDESMKIRIAESRYYFNFLKIFNIEKNRIANAENEVGEGNSNEENEDENPRSQP